MCAYLTAGMEPQSLARDMEVQRLSALFAERFLDTVAASLFDEDDDAASAAGATDFRGTPTVLAASSDERVNQGSRDAGSVGAAQLPFFAQQPLDVIPGSATSARDASACATCEICSKLRITFLSPSMCCLKTSQLLMPDCRGAPV